MVICDMVHFRCTNKSLDTGRRGPSGAPGAGPGYHMDAGRVQSPPDAVLREPVELLVLEAFGPDGQYPMRGNSERHALTETQRIPIDQALSRPRPRLLVHTELASPVSCPHAAGSTVTIPRLGEEWGGSRALGPDGKCLEGVLLHIRNDLGAAQ